MVPRQNDESLRLLALDGGGFRGLSSLLILQKLMEDVATDPDNPPKPCEYFHMIGGTSTGGLIALMLGRLEMSVQECIKVVLELSPAIFRKIHSPRFKVNVKMKLHESEIILKHRFDHEALEAGIKKLLEAQGCDKETLLKQSSPPTHTFVCATSDSISNTVVLSNYYSRRRGNDLRNVAKIWEVARATSAAASFFEPITIGGERFRDGGTGANNPIDQLWDEARDIFGDPDATWRLEEHLNCLVSIGTGVADLQAFGDDIRDVGKAFVAMATDSEKQHHDFRRRHERLFTAPQVVAFRFNVDRGLGDVGLEEVKYETLIRAATRAYIQLQGVSENFASCSKLLKGAN